MECFLEFFFYVVRRQMKQKRGETTPLIIDSFKKSFYFCKILLLHNNRIEIIQFRRN
jgi:hypothetical protein